MTLFNRIISLLRRPSYPFYVDEEKFYHNQPTVHGLTIRVVAKIDDFQSLYLERDTGPDDQIFDRTAVDLSGNAPRIYLAPKVIAGG